MSTVKELKAECKRRGITGYSRMKKDELIAVLDSTPLISKAAQDFADQAPEPVADDAIDFDPARFTDSDVQEIGKGSLANAAIYISALNAANGGRKGPSRLFRKRLRKAGFTAHAAVDVRKIDQYKADARNVA